MGYLTALVATCQVTVRQKGIVAFLRGQAPDLRRLDEVPGVSHTDLYRAYLPEVRAKATRAAVAGQITLQDLVSIKEWIAKSEGVPVIVSSQIETALLFVRAGGDLQTGLVDLESVLTLLDGRQPTGFGKVTIGRLKRARHMARWSSGA
jgi:hypothetical protein